MMAIFWITVNFGLVAAAVLGLYQNNDSAMNVLVFVTWMEFVCAILLCMQKDAQEKMKKKGRSVPAWISVSCDVFTVVAFASTGHFGYATMKFLSASIECAVYSRETGAA